MKTSVKARAKSGCAPGILRKRSRRSNNLSCTIALSFAIALIS